MLGLVLVGVVAWSFGAARPPKSDLWAFPPFLEVSRQIIALQIEAVDILSGGRQLSLIAAATRITSHSFSKLLMLTIDVIVNFIAHFFVSMQTKSQFGAPRIQMLVKREHDEGGERRDKTRTR